MRQPAREPPRRHSQPAQAPAPDDTRGAMAWMQTAAEYDAQNLMVYAAARVALDAALADPARDALPADERARTGKDPRTLPPAIILDIDETVLENTPFNVDLMHRPIDPGLPVEDFRRPSTSAGRLVRRAEAPRMGGAKAFLDYVASRGVAIRYITNRACAPDDPSCARRNRPAATWSSKACRCPTASAT